MGTKRNYEMTNGLLLASAKESFNASLRTQVADVCVVLISPQGILNIQIKG